MSQEIVDVLIFYYQEPKEIVFVFTELTLEMKKMSIILFNLLIHAS